MFCEGLKKDTGESQKVVNLVAEAVVEQID
ncbi:hypothetical protein BH09BAC3_BH09BAC3_38280 [soil metagenome]